jgi:hypothetical protein
MIMARPQLSREQVAGIRIADIPHGNLHVRWVVSPESAASKKIFFFLTD